MTLITLFVPGSVNVTYKTLTLLLLLRVGAAAAVVAAAAATLKSHSVKLIVRPGVVLMNHGCSSLPQPVSCVVTLAIRPDGSCRRVLCGAGRQL